MRGHLLVAALSGTASATTYALTVYAPGTALNGMDLNAAEQSFFTGMGGKPQTYCPDSIRYTVGCPPEEGTLVNGLMLSMAVTVPGGQAIYIPPSGAVSYLQAHIGFPTEGSLTGGWYNKTAVSSCAENITMMDWMAPTAPNQTQTGGLLFCHAAPDVAARLNATYQLYANTTTFNQTGCLAAIGIIEHGSSAAYGTWQYN